jgi:hypothetical protein
MTRNNLESNSLIGGSGFSRIRTGATGRWFPSPFYVALAKPYGCLADRMLRRLPLKNNKNNWGKPLISIFSFYVNLVLNEF